MSGVAGRSGGANRLSIEEHRIRGTFRADRHGQKKEVSAAPVSDGDRQQALGGLTGLARRIAASLIDMYDGWDSASLHTLRQYASSCGRLAVLQQLPDDDASALHRELRINIQLLRVLNLEAQR